MSRLSSAMRWDITLQWRQGFYYICIFAAFVWVVFLSQFSKESLQYLFPPFLLLSLNITTYFFVAGLVLFEKGEGVLEGLIVTPLKMREYLLSKTATLTFLALIENLIIVILVYRTGIALLPLITGIIFMSVVYTLIGFIVVARYDSISEYLMPASFFIGILQLPWIGYFGLLNPYIFYVFPTQGPLLLLKWGFQPIEYWQIIYAVTSSLVWILIFYKRAHTSFYTFIVKTRGV